MCPVSIDRMLRVFQKLFRLAALIVQGEIIQPLFREIEGVSRFLAIFKHLTRRGQAKLPGKTLLFVLEHSLHFILRLDATP